MTRILLVDDDREMCEELSELLQLNHYVVQMCHDGKTGLGFIQSDGSDIVLLDLKMPGMNGREVLKHLKKEHPAIKVLVLTGYALSSNLLPEEKLFPANDDRENNDLTKADGVINKPFDVEELLAKIKELITPQKPD